MTLAHLTKTDLTQEEFDEATDLMAKETDRGASIMGAALVEESLRYAIIAYLVREEDEDALFYDEGAPFRTLRSKTVAAHAMGLIDDKAKDDIDIIRNIRNQFSHSLRALDFRHPEIKAACDRLVHHSPPNIVEEAAKLPGPGFGRQYYQIACRSIYANVLQQSIARLANMKAALTQT